MTDYAQIRQELLALDHDCGEACGWCLKVRRADEVKLEEMAVECLPWEETAEIRKLATWR